MTKCRHDDIQIWRYKNKYIQVYSKCMRRYSKKFMRWGAWFKTLVPHKAAHGSARRVMQGWKRCKLAPRSHPCSCHRESCNGMKRLLLGSAMGWGIGPGKILLKLWRYIRRRQASHEPGESYREAGVKKVQIDCKKSSLRTSTDMSSLLPLSLFLV